MALVVLIVVTLGLGFGSGSLYGQRFEDLTTKTPLAPGDCLIIGFLGGRDRWDDDRKAVRRLALKLRAMNRPGLHVETVENTKRKLAVELVHRAFDRNADGRLDDEERRSARLILYGQSFGGAAVVKLARELEPLGVRVLLTVQVDSVGRDDAVIPSNVARAANLFQSNGWVIRGEPQIRAADPRRTKIAGNFRFDYTAKQVDISGVPWHKKLFRVAHTKMEHDPEVWARVEELILSALN